MIMFSVPPARLTLKPLIQMDSNAAINDFSPLSNKGNRSHRHDLIALFLYLSLRPTVPTVRKQNLSSGFLNSYVKWFFLALLNDFLENSAEYLSEHVLTPRFFSS